MFYVEPLQQSVSLTRLPLTIQRTLDLKVFFPRGFINPQKVYNCSVHFSKEHAGTFGKHADQTQIGKVRVLVALF